MDFTGIGYISEQSFLNSLACQKSGYSQDELKDFIEFSGFFKGQLGMNFDTFKKTFFPQFCQITLDPDESDLEIKDKQEKKEILKNQEKQPEIIRERLIKLERMLKDRFSNNWDSVRKAFLGLDTDYDGHITVEDILRNFGNSSSY